MLARGTVGIGSARAQGTRRAGGRDSPRRRGSPIVTASDEFNDSGESDWMEKARATANKRAAEFRKEGRGAQPGAVQTSRRYTRAGREEDRQRTAAVRGYEMDEDGNWQKPEPSVDELLRGTAW